jgi:cytidine deaminase
MSSLADMIALARAAMDKAHAPYSRFKVGACVRAASGKLYAGCNVENAAYPQGQCAEATAIGAMVTAGDREILEVVLMGGGPKLCTPCGGCRQKLVEFAKPGTPVHLCTRKGRKRTVTLGQLTPMFFGPKNLGK